jgi:hypothetical protein
MRRLILALLGLLALTLPAYAVSDSSQYPKPYCLYNSADPSLSDGDVYPFRCGPDGKLLFTESPSGAPVGTPTNKGSTITTGGTAQTPIAANVSRKYAICENPPSATEDLFISITTTATTTNAGNFADLAPGGSATIPGTAAVSVNAATTGHRFICTEWQ